jgi:hypothetical protein
VSDPVDLAPAEPATPGARTSDDEPFVPAFPPLTLGGRLLRRRRLHRGVGRLVYRSVNRWERHAFLRSLPFSVTGSDQRFVQRRAGRFRVVSAQPGVTGRQAVVRNRDLVVDLCESLSLSYFVVPETGERRVRIGVTDADWQAFVDGVVVAGAKDPIYVGVDASDGRRRRRWPELACDTRVQRAAREQPSLEVFRMMLDPDTGQLFDRPWACVVERWQRGVDGELVAPGRNGRTTRLGATSQAPAVTLQSGRRLRTFAAFGERAIFDVDFPIDVVYMWVDSGDLDWQARKASALAALGVDPGPSAANDERFRDNGELRFSLRSLERYAPWVRRVFLVTDQQIPHWLDTAHPRLEIVDHRELFGGAGRLPSFNSHAIGARLHHIVGLSEHYLHFNDDFFLGRDVAPGLFFQSNGMANFFLSRSTLELNDPGVAPKHEDARRNVVRLLQRDFGRTPTRAFFHTPITQRRSTMFELEQRYPEVFSATWSNQFRDSSDYEINSWLHHYYGYLVGKSAIGQVRYDYFELSNKAAWTRMKRLLRTRDRDAFCVNDSADTTPEQRLRGTEWLAAYFPAASSFER